MPDHADPNRETRVPDPANPSDSPGRDSDEAAPPSNGEEGGTLAPTTGPHQPVGEGTAPWPSVPGYEIQGPLGQGGMGVVYLARQVQADRLVALKMIRHAEYAGPDERARFRTEAQALARLQHPHVVQIFEVGEHNGLPFFSLEYCPAGSLAQRLEGAPLPPRQAAVLALELARALEAAHASGVLHRDLKPANVLLAGEPGRPLEQCRAKLTDFGLARRQDVAGQTQTGAILGTPSYMAPEQAGSKSKEMGPTTDIYGLGALLYELVTGRPPFRAATDLDTILQLLEKEPVPPRQLQPGVPRDLETLCLKCLEKEPAKRYPSAQELADDLGRFLRGEPVWARPVGQIARGWRWVRRNPVMAGLALGLALALLLGSVISGVAAVSALRWADTATENAKLADARADVLEEKVAEIEKLNQEAQGRASQLAQSLKETEKARDRTAEALFQSNLFLAQSLWDQSRAAEAQDRLNQIPPDKRHWEWGYLKRKFQGSYATLLGHTNGVRCLAFTPYGRLLASADMDGAIKIWDADSGTPLRSLSHGNYVSSVAFSLDGSRLASGGVGPVLVWDPFSGLRLLSLDGHQDTVSGLAFSPDGRRLASASLDGTVRVWDVNSRAVLRSLKSHDPVTSVAFSPDGRHLASGTLKAVWVWDLASGARLQVLQGHTGAVGSVAFSPDGRLLASCAYLDTTVKVWDANTWAETRSLSGHSGFVNSVAFSPDGRRLVSGSEDGTVRMWDVSSGAALLNLPGHTGTVQSVAFSPDGRRLASGSRDKTVKIWDMAAGEGLHSLQGHDGHLVEAVAFSSDGRHLASAGWDQSIRVWDADRLTETRSPIRTTSHVLGLAFSPDGHRLASGDADGTVKVWDVKSGEQMRSLETNSQRVHCVAYSLDGRLAAANWFGTIKVWKAETGTDLLSIKDPPGTADSIAFSPDGRYLASGYRDGTVKVWDASSGRALHTLGGHGPKITSLAFSPDGLRLASSAANDPTVRVWDVARGAVLHTLPGHTDGVASVTFSPDGRRLASAGKDETVKVWEASSGKELLSLKGHKGEVQSIVFSRDGERLAACGQDLTVCVRVIDLGPSSTKDAAFRLTKSRIDPNWYEDQARQCEQEGHWFAAAFHRSRFVLAHPLEESAWQRLESACARGNCPDRVIHTARQVLAEHPGLPPIHFRQGLLLARSGQWFSAVQIIRRGVRLYGGDQKEPPGLSAFFSASGQQAAALGDWRTAADAYLQTILWGAKDRSDFQDLALSQLAGGNLSGYRQTCRVFLDHIKEVESRWSTRALFALLCQGMAAAAPGGGVAAGTGLPLGWHGARRAFEEEVGWWARWTTHTCIQGQDCPVDPLRLIALEERAVRIFPGTPNCHANLGAALYRVGQYPEALTQLTRAMELQNGTGSPWHLLFLAMTHHRLGHAAEASKWLKQALAEHEKRKGSYDWKAWLLFDRLHTEARELIRSP